VKSFLTWRNQSRCKACLKFAIPLFLGLFLAKTGSAIAQTENSTAPFRLINQAEAAYNTQSFDDSVTSILSNPLKIKPDNRLTDPAGQLLGCGGQPLADYTGFGVGLYETNAGDPTGSELGPLLKLTPTELPDDPANTIPKGIQPNSTNVNPFSLSNADSGRFSFLLDRGQGQLEIGKTYLLVVNPPPASTLYTQRRIKIQILDTQSVDGDEIISYRAIALDGLPITSAGATQFDQTSVVIADADRVSLQLLALRLSNTLCQQNQIRLTKSGDRASAAPGDIVIYRLSARNSSDGPLNKTTISDVLPLGFKFLPASVRAEQEKQTVPVQVTQNGQSVTLTSNTPLAVGNTLNIVYAAQLTTDAIRGTGKNYANISSYRVDNGAEVKDGPAIHRVRLNAGLLSNCGTIIGRVFEDRNFDGEQQDGEPGIPNAVVYLEDGNRITSDPNGLFSVKCALPGYHTGVLDPMSVPGYKIAPNHRFIERNSESRLVRLAPGSMVRMNFAVVPTGKPQERQP
jgi:uncharacterized repeat protein (TIGR01451 family)